MQLDAGMPAVWHRPACCFTCCCTVHTLLHGYTGYICPVQRFPSPSYSEHMHPCGHMLSASTNLEADKAVEPVLLDQDQCYQSTTTVVEYTRIMVLYMCVHDRWIRYPSIDPSHRYIRKTSEKRLAARADRFPPSSSARASPTRPPASAGTLAAPLRV